MRPWDVGRRVAGLEPPVRDERVERVLIPGGRLQWSATNSQGVLEWKSLGRHRAQGCSGRPCWKTRSTRQATRDIASGN